MLFLVLGLGVFAVERWWSAREQRLVVTGADVARIAELWQAQMGRPATEAELDGLIEQHVREEVLYRSALALGLDRDDVIVRRRLAQKMAFVLEEGAVAEPIRYEVRSHWLEHPERWQRPGRVSFQHVYWSAEKNGESAERAAGDALGRLRARGGDGWQALGDPFMLQREFGERTLEEIARLFGDGFAAELAETPMGDWQGPLRSTFGAHLVRVLSRTEPVQPPFEEVEEAVREDLLRQRRAEATERAYQRLRRRYRVEVER